MSDEAFPIISVTDLPATRAFYERLGFAQTYQQPEAGDPAFVVMERAGAALGIGAGGAEEEDAFAYWVYVDDVDETLADLRAAGSPVVAVPADQPWGERTASTRDPAGNLVHLGATR